MPNKKTEREEPQVEVAVEEKKQQAAKVALCGHVNHQHYNSKGRLSEIACDLSLKHQGDHHAKYMKNIGEPVNDEKGRVTKVIYREEEADAWWNDAAGQSAGDVVIGVVDTLNLNQKDMIMSVLKANPDLTADEALKLAKAKAEWNLQEPS